MTIPSDINSLLTAEALCCYRDEVKWPVYPVHPPWAKVDFPGKQPAVRRWWEYDPHDCDIATWFKTGRPYNIGMCFRGGIVCVDLDSKQDRGASVRKYRDEHPEISGPLHATHGGDHRIYLCGDLPKWMKANGKPYEKPLTFQINEAVTAELFYSDHSNIVLPPSMHPKDEFI